MNIDAKTKAAAIAFAETIESLTPFDCGLPDCSVCTNHRNQVVPIIFSHDRAVRYETLQHVLNILIADADEPDYDNSDRDMNAGWDTAMQHCIARIRSELRK